MLKETGAGSLKLESTTRWSAREEATRAVSLHLDKIIELLEKLAECPNERVDTRSKARGLLSAVEKYEFFAYLEFWSHILRPINFAQKKMQQSGLNTTDAAGEINKLSSILGNETEREKIITQSINFAEEGSNNYGFSTNRRIRKKKRMAGEGTSDEGLDRQEEFKRVAREILDRLCMEMKERFQRLRDHVEHFGFLLQPELLLKSMDEETLQKHSADFASFYDDVQAISLFNDIIDARVMFFNSELPRLPVDILKKISSYGKDVCPSLATAIRILLTITTSIASCERSFSKLKLVKNYLRSTMSQDRLNSLVLMSVESEVLDKIDMSDIIEEFAAKKARRQL